MKNSFFLVSHLGSGSSDVVKSLNTHPRIEVFSTDIMYSHPTDLEGLFKNRHKNNTVAALYGDHILYNMSISWKGFYRISKFVYMIRDANALTEISLPPKEAYLYYSFRLRRICEMVKHTPNPMVLNYSNFNSSKLQEYLAVKGEISVPKLTSNPVQEIPLEIMEKAQACYERHLFYLKGINAFSH